MSQQIADWASRVNADPELRAIWDKAVEEQDSLDEYETRRWLWFFCEIMFMYEGRFMLCLKGHISPDAWDANANLMVGVLLQNSAANEWWVRCIAPFSPKFYEHVEALRRARDSAWLFQRTNVSKTTPDDSLETDA